MRLLLLNFAIFSLSLAHAGPRVVGNGAGGLAQKGELKTIGSVGLYVDPLQEQAVPNLDVIIQAVDSFGLNDEQKATVLAALVPTGERRYFKVVNEDVDPETMEKLRAEYAQLTGQPKDSIVLFALTQPGERSTYLLPQFFKLKAAEQAAILFHEAHWLLKPSATYHEVVKTEVALQKYLEGRAMGSYHPDFARELAVLYGPAVTMNMDLAADISSGALALTGANTGILVRTILPEKFKVECRASTGGATSTVVMGPELQLHLYQLLRSNPNSHFLRSLLDFLRPDGQGKAGVIDFRLFAQYRRASNCSRLNDMTFDKVSVEHSFSQGRTLVIELNLASDSHLL